MQGDSADDSGKGCGVQGRVQEWARRFVCAATRRSPFPTKPRRRWCSCGPAPRRRHVRPAAAHPRGPLPAARWARPAACWTAAHSWTRACATAACAARSTWSCTARSAAAAGASSRGLRQPRLRLHRRPPPRGPAAAGRLRCPGSGARSSTGWRQGGRGAQLGMGPALGWQPLAASPVQVRLAHQRWVGRCPPGRLPPSGGAGGAAREVPMGGHMPGQAALTPAPPPSPWLGSAVRALGRARSGRRGVKKGRRARGRLGQPPLPAARTWQLGPTWLQRPVLA